VTVDNVWVAVEPMLKSYVVPVTQDANSLTQLKM